MSKLSVIAVILFFSASACWLSETSAEPLKSHPLLGKPLPDFSGFLVSPEKVSQQGVSSESLLKRSPKGYVLVLSASWCEPCRKGLELLSGARARFEARGVKLFLLLADRLPDAVALMKRYRFDWAVGISDKFKMNAQRLSPKANPQGGAMKASLPLSIVVNDQGVVTRVIREEGDDFIDLLLGDRP